MRFKHISAIGAFLAFISFVTSRVACAQDGPYSVTSSGYYQLLNRFEPLVATDRNVDLWAQIYRPTQTDRGPFPLIIFLHGNHGTCGYYDPTLKVRVDDRSDYTTTGQCPPGYVVTPNHLGYTYMAEKLASYGYIVVSINANRGITAGAGIVGDRGLNLMRGRLVLRHLALLSGWNRGGGSVSAPPTLGFNPVGSMDFSQVGYFGHSRGGEGVRAALQQYRDPGSPFPALIGPLAVKSIFEVGPVDGQTSRVLDANGVYSNILLPACDGDVSNLQGIHVLDRVFLNTSPDPVQDFHSTTKVWGANHNAYNTEWMTSDSPGCDGTDPLFPQAGTSVPQQVTAREQLVPFFRATVGSKPDKSLAALFDPINPVPNVITDITKVDRGYLPAPLGANTMLVENFAGVTSGASTAVGVSVVQQAASFEHYTGTRVATVSWTPTSPPLRYFQVDFDAGKDVSAYKYFSLRTALRCFGTICDRKASDFGELAYQVSLVDSFGFVSNPVSTAGLTRLSRPIGDEPTNLHSDLYTLQIPTLLFFGVNKNHIKAVRFSFPLYQQGTVDVTDLAFLRNDPLAEFPYLPSVAGLGSAIIKAGLAKAGAILISPAAAAEGNTIRISAQPTVNQKTVASVVTPPMTDIVLTSKRSFMVGNALPTVKIGKVVLEDGTISADGKSLTVSVPTAMMGQLPAGVPVSVVLQKSLPVWQFGSLPSAR